jgi:transcriptional regulator GlxA family with amidase domain
MPGAGLRLGELLPEPMDERHPMASGLLRTTAFSVAEVGCSSEEAFSRAFKRALRAAPTRWRSEAPPTG